MDRYKTCLVAHDFTQTFGVDYEETFSSIARLNSIHVLLSISINQSWELCELDVKNAFLYGDLTEQVLIEQPPGYVAQRNDRVCLFRKVIYELKQSPRAWFEKFNKIVMDNDFQCCVIDHLVFIKRQSRGSVILTVYVDDILLTGSDTTGIMETKEHLKKYFISKDIERPKYFLGIEFAHDKYRMALLQRKYALDLLKETGLLGCKPK